MEKSELTLAEYAGYFQTIQTKLTTLKNKFNDSSLNDLAAIVQNLIDSNPFKSFTVGDFPAKLSASSCVILSIKDNELGGNTYFGLPTSEYATLKPKLDRINNTTHYRKIFVIPSSNACNCFYGCFTSETPFAGKDLLFDPSTWASTSKFIKLGSGSSTWTTSSSDFTNYRNNYTYFRLDDSDTYKVCGKQNFANNSSVTSGPISAGFKLNAASGAGAIIPSNRNVGEVSEVTDSSPSNHCLQDELLFSADGNNIIGEIGNFGTGNLILTLTPEIQDINFLKSCADKLPIGINNMQVKFNGTTFSFENSILEEKIVSEEDGYLSCGCPTSSLEEINSAEEEAGKGVQCAPLGGAGGYASGGSFIGSFYMTDINLCKSIFDPSSDYSGGAVVLYAFTSTPTCPIDSVPKQQLGLWDKCNIIGFPMHVVIKLLKDGIFLNKWCVGYIETAINAINACLDLQNSTDISYKDYGFTIYSCNAFRTTAGVGYANFISSGGNEAIVKVSESKIELVEEYGGNSDKILFGGETKDYTSIRSAELLLAQNNDDSCPFYMTASGESFSLKILK